MIHAMGYRIATHPIRLASLVEVNGGMSVGDAVEAMAYLDAAEEHARKNKESK